MADFTFDTSGVVRFDGGTLGYLSWEGLGQLGGAFTQAYAEAVCRAAEDTLGGFTITGVRYSDLSREALEMIVADCARATTNDPPRWQVPADSPKMAEHGRYFWQDRQKGRHSDFPPLTVSLGDDGKVHLTVAHA